MTDYLPKDKSVNFMSSLVNTKRNCHEKLQENIKMASFERNNNETINNVLDMLKKSPAVFIMKSVIA